MASENWAGRTSRCLDGRRRQGLRRALLLRGRLREEWVLRCGGSCHSRGVERGSRHGYKVRFFEVKASAEAKCCHSADQPAVS